MLDHVFHNNIIAYSQQNWYVRLAIYTDLFTLKCYEFNKAQSPISLPNSSFNNSLSAILPPLTIKTPSPAATFNINERPTAAGTLLIDTTRNLSHPATASPTNEAINNMLETIEYNSIRSHIVSKTRKKNEPIIAQKLKPLLENFESLIKIAKETYAHQFKVLKEELHCKNKIINTLLEIIGKFGNDKRNTQPVPLISLKNDLTKSPNKVTDSETDPKSDEQQQSHDNKQQISSKELSENCKEKGSTNSVLVTDSVTVPTLGHKQQSHDDKQKRRSKKLCENSKGESSNTTTNVSIEEQLNEFKRKKKEEYYKYKQSVSIENLDFGEKFDLLTPVPRPNEFLVN